MIGAFASSVAAAAALDSLELPDVVCGHPDETVPFASGIRHVDGSWDFMPHVTLMCRSCAARTQVPTEHFSPFLTIAFGDAQPLIPLDFPFEWFATPDERLHLYAETIDACADQWLEIRLSGLADAVTS